MTTRDTPSADSILKDVLDTEKSSDPEVLLSQFGKELINRLFMMIRNGRIHDLNNNAVKSSIEAMRDVLQPLADVSHDIAVMSVGDSIYLNRTLLKSDFSSFENFLFLADFLSTHHISGFRFQGIPNFEDFQLFLGALVKGSQVIEDPQWIGNIRINQIAIIPLKSLTESEKRVVSVETLADPNYLMRLYFKTSLFLGTFISSIQKGEIGSISQLQRSVHEFIDAMGDETRNILALAALRSQEDYLVYHSVNVALLSLLVGRELGLSKQKLSDLGAAALLHDIGKVQISNDILGKNLPLTPEDWAQLKKSNTYSLMHLIRLKGFNESALRRMLVAYEHTLSYSEEGQSRRPTLLSRIVAVTHCYDAMTTAQSYRDALLPHEAFKIMAQDEGKKFDPAIFRVFVSLLTPYPPGALVMLNTREVGVVMDVGASRPSSSQPKVLAIYNSSGEKTVPNILVDLARDSQNRTIVKTLDATKYSINPWTFLFPSVSHI